MGTLNLNLGGSFTAGHFRALNLLCKDALSFGERVWVPPQALHHRARFGNRFLPGSSSSWFSGQQTMMGGKRRGWGLPPLYEGASTASLSAHTTSCPLTLSVPLGEGPEQARGVRDRRWVKLASVVLGTRPTAVTLLAWERRGQPICAGRH